MMSTFCFVSYWLFIGVHTKHNMFGQWTTLNLHSFIIIISYVQGPVGTERNQDGCSWLPGVMMRLEPANTQGISRMGCGAALGRGHRHQGRRHIASVELIPMAAPWFTSCIPAKLHRSSRKSLLPTRFWLFWGRRSAALFTIFIQTGSRA